MAQSAGQPPSDKAQGKPFRSQIGDLTEIERVAAAGVAAKEMARSASKDVRPFGAQEVEKRIDYLARPDLQRDSED